MNSYGLFVCDSCFEDLGLIEFIRDNASANKCSFCPAQDDVPIAAHIDDVSAHFRECLFMEYDLAVNALGWEGGYIGTHWDPENLVAYELELEFPQDNLDSLLPHLFGDYYEFILNFDRHKSAGFHLLLVFGTPEPRCAGHYNQTEPNDGRGVDMLKVKALLCLVVLLIALPVVPVKADLSRIHRRTPMDGVRKAEGG